MRQRVRTRRSPLRFISQVLLFLFSLGLIWYGLMLILLAAGVPSETVDLISGYRTAYDFLSGLTPEDISGLAQVILIAGGLLLFVLFLYLAYKEIPRPRFTRGDLRLTDDDRGRVTLQAGAIERVAETAAERNHAVGSASGRYGDDEVNVDIMLRRTNDVTETLRDVRRRVREALTEHGVPETPVNVVLAGFDRPQQPKREVS